MIVLASSSPRRRALLREAGIRFRVVRPDYEEKMIKGLSPRELVLRHAAGKAASVVADKTVLAADTVVYFRGKIIGKPRDINQACRILTQLQGQWHTVWTGVAVRMRKEGKVRDKVFAVKTLVRIRPMTDTEIRSYFRRVNPLDKAGAYAIQSKHAIVESVRGSYTNAVGLPMERLLTILKA